MPIDSEFLDMMVSTITWRPFAGNSSSYSDEKTRGAPVELRCHLQRRTQDVRTKDGSVVTSYWTIWVFGAPAIDPEDEVTLPDGTKPPIITVEKTYDEDGEYAVKILTQ